MNARNAAYITGEHAWRPNTETLIADFPMKMRPKLFKSKKNIKKSLQGVLLVFERKLQTFLNL